MNLNLSLLKLLFVIHYIKYVENDVGIVDTRKTRRVQVNCEQHLMRKNIDGIK